MHTTSYNGKFFVIDLEIYNANVLVSIEQDQEDVVLALVEHGVIPSLESPALKMYMEPFMDMKSTNLARTAMYENGVIAVRLTHFDENDIDDKDPALQDPQLMLDWINENLTWEQLSPYAEYVKTDRQESTRNKNFVKATKKVVEWERQLSIFDFISKCDMIISNEDEED